MNTGIKNTVGIILILIGIVGAFYIGIYLGIIAPIIALASAYDTGTLTGAIMANSAIWFFLKEIFAGVWMLLFAMLAATMN